MLVTDLAISGWLCCPIEEIQLDTTVNAKGKHHLARERVIDKLYYMKPDEEKGTAKDKFWVEWEDFHSQNGSYACAFIWNADYLQKGQSHWWHKSYSLPYTNIFGVVACQVP